MSQPRSCILYQQSFTWLHFLRTSCRFCQNQHVLSSVHLTDVCNLLPVRWELLQCVFFIIFLLPYSCKRKQLLKMTFLVNEQHVSVMYIDIREKITRGLRAILPPKSKKEPSKKKKSPWKLPSIGLLQCKSLFDIADLVNGMWKVAPGFFFFFFLAWLTMMMQYHYMYLNILWGSTVPCMKIKFHCKLDLHTWYSGTSLNKEVG